MGGQGHGEALGEDQLGERITVVADGDAALTAPLPADPADIDHLVFLGTGWTIGLAHEAALKVREAAQAYSESYPARDFRHGPVAVAGPRSLIWSFGDVPAERPTSSSPTGTAPNEKTRLRGPATATGPCRKSIAG